jgi:adenosylmethionine---8-amino-7-oxononanoate aminotransferase
MQSQDYIWHPFTPQIGAAVPIEITHSLGCKLFTKDGKTIIDAIGSWWVNIHGHAHAAFGEVLKKQADTLEHVIFAGFTHKPALDLAAALMPLLPGDMAKLFFSDNGSTAVEVGLKMAYQYWYNQGIPRSKFIALSGSYHGDTFGAMSVAEPSAFTDAFRPMLFQVDYLEIPYCQNIYDALTEDDYRAIAQFEALLLKEPAGFIFEPLVQGANGMRFYKLALLNQLLLKAKEAGVICIADEVMTGFGRLDTLFACELLNEKADIICLSKGLTGGVMAMGLTACNTTIYEPFHTSDLLKTFFHGHSFTGNPLACLVALTSLKLLLEKVCYDNRSRIANKHQDIIFQWQSKTWPVSIRQQGVILALELHTGSETSYVHEARHFLYQRFIELGVLLRPLGNVIYLLPAYVISDEELNTCYTAIEQVLDELFDN